MLPMGFPPGAAIPPAPRPVLSGHGAKGYDQGNTEKGTRMLARWLISAVSIYIVALLGIGVEVRNFWAALVAALVLGLANLLVRPILLLLTLPINLVTLGLFTLVVNGIVFLIASAFTPGFHVRGFGAAIIGALLTGIATAILSSLLGTK